MGKRYVPLKYVVSGLFLIVFIYFVNHSSIHNYISTLKGKPVTAQYQEEWGKRIDLLRAKIEASPIDAHIDRVWQAIPGYNGLRINKEATLKRLAQKGKWDSSLVVVEQLEPKVQLKDLQPSPVYRGNPEKPVISFMINVAWGNEYLPAILNTLQQNNVKATFFLDGSWVSKNPKEAREIFERGHEIGNHAYSHPDLKQVSDYRIRMEITKTNREIQKVLGIKPKLFAPPSGSYDQRAVQSAAKEGMQTILWTLDTVDWRKPTPSQIKQRIIPHLASGSLILMHPTESSARALPDLIKAAKAKGFQVGTVSDCLSSKRIYTIE
jgi:peptidoglycan-N-acetylglucosamine deacetylase